MDRQDAALWASSILRMFPDNAFRSTPHTELIEYALSRLIDDDWISSNEIEIEWQDLAGRLEDAEKGVVRLP